MRIPPYWAKSCYEGTDHKGQSLSFHAFGWSFTSLQEAQENAAKRARHIFDLIINGQSPDRYEYHDRPIREEILKQISDGESPIATITRNRYGAIVLNCRSVLFVDVDFPKTGRRGILGALMGAFSKKRRDAKRHALIEETIGQVRAWAENHPEHAFRLYRTKEGLRLLFTGKEYEPASVETASILKGLKADPLYVKLTQKQECFRARITSKPWRCGSPLPPSPFPWNDSEEEAEYRKWETEYAKKDSEFKVCELISEFGNRAVLSSVRTIIDLHDRGSRIESMLPLA